MSRIREYVAHGPYAGGNSLIRRAFGAWVWWRTWVSLTICVAGLVSFFWIEQNLHQWAALLPLFVGIALLRGIRILYPLQRGGSRQ